MQQRDFAYNLPGASRGHLTVVFLCRKLSGGGVGTGDLDGARRGRKLGFILHYHNRITVANKASISAPTVAFGEDPSLFPLRAGPRCLKKIYPLFPLS